MPIVESKRIEIHGYNIKAAQEKGVDEVTKFVNKLLEQFFSGDIVVLDQENKEYLESVSEECNKSVNSIINAVIKTIEIVPPKQEKVKIELEEKVVDIKKSGKKRVNVGKDLSQWRYE